MLESGAAEAADALDGREVHEMLVIELSRGLGEQPAICFAVELVSRVLSLAGHTTEFFRIRLFASLGEY